MSKRPFGSHFNAPIIPRTDNGDIINRIVKDSFEDLLDLVMPGFFENSKSLRDKMLARGTLPKVNIKLVPAKESSKGLGTLNFSMAVPGINKEDLEINADFSKRTFTISYNKKENKVVDDGYIVKEFSESSFFREFAVPQKIKTDSTNELIKFDSEEDIKVNLKDGVLEVQLTRVKESEKEKDPNVKRIGIITE